MAAKVFYTVGGQGKKPDVFVKNVSAGRFTKRSRRLKPLLTSEPTPSTC